MSAFLLVLIPIAILAYALVGGVFLAFSDFIMRSLAYSGGPAAMRVINREVFRWVFMTLFLGMAAASLGITGYAAVYLGGPAGTLLMTAGLVYLAGCFGVTVFFNVPMNEALAGMDPSSDAMQDYWTGIYLPRWTLWNTVRTVACIVSAALLLLALSLMAQAQMSPL